MLKFQPAKKANTNFSPSAQDTLAATPPAAEPTIAESAGAEDAGDKQSATFVKGVGKATSPEKIAANKKNGELSRGPKTARGKFISSWNSTRHGLLSRRLMQLDDHKKKEFSALLKSLRQDLDPIRTLEEILVEKLAYEYLRTARALEYENAESNLGYLSGEIVSSLVRYQSMISRQFFQVINQLERVQRLRRGEDVPVPLSVQVVHEHTSASEKERLDE